MAGTRTYDARSHRQASIETVWTRHTVLSLLLRGLDLREATNLTAFLCGIPVADRCWTLPEINRLLFLRELQRRGKFGPADDG